MKFFDGLKRTGSKISFGFGKKGSRSRQGSAADEAPTLGDEASMSSGEDNSTSASAPQQPSGGEGVRANMAGQHAHAPDDDDDFDPDEPMMTRLEQTMSNLEVKGNGEGEDGGEGGMRREDEDLGPTPRRFGPPHGGADDSTGGVHPSMLMSGVDFSALSFLGRMNSDQWPQEMDGTASSPVPGGPPSSAQGQSHPGVHHMASQHQHQQQYQYVPGSMAAPMPKLPSHHHQHHPQSNSSAGGGGNGEFMFFRSSGGESDKFKLDEPMGGADEEDLGPGLPPMLQSNSSINVYVPTKMRRMGSHTTGTYADPANSSKQELDTRHRHRDEDESRRATEQGGMEPPGPSGGGGMAPPSALSSASGNEIINLDNFRSNSSGTIPAHYQHTHTPSQQQFNSQGSAAGPVVGSGLDQSCIEAILMLSSGGREGQGQSGGSSGGSGSAWGSTGGVGSGGMAEASPSTVGVGAPPPDVCHVASDVQSPVFVQAQQGARLPPHMQQQQQQQPHLQQSPASMPHMAAYTSDPGLQHPTRMPGLQDVQGGPSEAWFPSDPTALLAAHMASSFTGVFRQDDPVQQQQHQQQLQQQQDMRLQHLQQLQQQQAQYATYDASGAYYAHGAPPPQHQQHYQPPYYADQYRQPHGAGMVPSSSSGDLDSDTMSVMTAASIQSSSGNLGGGGGHTRVQPGRQSKAKARQTIRDVELEPVDGAAPEDTVSTPSTQGTSAAPLTPMGDRSVKGMASKSMGSSTTMKHKDGAAERESLKGRYKCRYCGEIKSNHRCPALVDVPRAQIGTQTDLDLTIGVGGRPVIPEDLYKCRFVTARVAPTSRAMLYGGPPAAPTPHAHAHPHLPSPGPMGPLPRTPGLPPGAAMGMAQYTSLCEAIPVVPPMPAQTGGAGPGAATSARVSYAPQPAMGGYCPPAPQQFMSPPTHTPTAAHTHAPHTPHTHPHDYAQLTPPTMTPHHTPHTHALPPPHTQQPSGLPPIPSPHPSQPAYTTYSDYAAI